MVCSVCHFQFCWVCDHRSKSDFFHKFLFGGLLCELANVLMSLKIKYKLVRMLYTLVVVAGFLLFPIAGFLYLACVFVIGFVSAPYFILTHKTPWQKRWKRRMTATQMRYSAALLLLAWLPGAVLLFIVGCGFAACLTIWYYFSLLIWGTYIIGLSTKNLITGRAYMTNQAN